jgi:lysozyme-related protein Hpa2
MRKHLASCCFLLGAAAQGCDTSGLFDRVAAKYGLDPALLYAISITESGARPNAVAKNANGSIDRGAMQINSIHLPRLEKLGIRKDDLFNACVNVDVGAWILDECFKRWGVNWDGVGCYNSNTPKFRQSYAAKVSAKYAGLLKKSSGNTSNQLANSAKTLRYVCASPSGCEVSFVPSGILVAAADPRRRQLLVE